MSGDPEKTKRLHAVVQGRVQGVFFRAWTQEQASQLNLVGWVRNLPSGEVEFVAEGPHWALEQLLELSYKGPSAARVTNVKFDWGKSEGDLSSFGIRY